MQLYDHILNQDGRYKSAANTASKTGAAYQGWAPKPSVLSRFVDLFKRSK